MSAPRWQPLWRGTTLQERSSLCDVIGRDFVDFASEPGALPGAESAGLAAGHAGIALTLAYVSKCGIPVGSSLASKHLSVAIECLTTTPLDAGLFSGLAGIGWTIHQLNLLLPDVVARSAEAAAAAIDSILADAARALDARGEYDLVSGSAGLSLYAIQRLPSKAALSCLRLIIDGLWRRAERTREGFTWRTPTAWRDARRGANGPEPHYNLGLAHGVPSLIGVLGDYCALGIGGRKSRALLTGAVDWLFAQRSRARSDAAFSYYATESGAPFGAARVAWCYGDLGIAIALLNASRAVGHTDWEHEAIEVGKCAARRTAQDSGVVDAGLCHGSAGNAHIFNRLYQATGDNEFRVAALQWADRTLAYYRRGIGVAGFETMHRVAADRPLAPIADASFLIGTAGILLALLAATTDQEPTWDRVLLCCPAALHDGP